MTISDPKYAYQLATNLLKAQRSLNHPSHPTHILSTAKATEALWRSLRWDKARDSDYVDELRSEILYLYKQADVACEAFATEKDINSVLVKTRYATFLHESRATKEDEVLEKKLNDEVWELLKSGVDGRFALGRWYEMVGDMESDPLKAEKIYLEGVRWLREYFQLWVKLAGACLHAHGHLRDIQFHFDGLTHEEAAELLKRTTRQQLRKLKRKHDEYLELRVRDGISQLKEHLSLRLHRK